MTIDEKNKKLESLVGLDATAPEIFALCADLGLDPWVYSDLTITTADYRTDRARIVHGDNGVIVYAEVG